MKVIKTETSNVDLSIIINSSYLDYFVFSPTFFIYIYVYLRIVVILFNPDQGDNGVHIFPMAISLKENVIA